MTHEMRQDLQAAEFSDPKLVALEDKVNRDVFLVGTAKLPTSLHPDVQNPMGVLVMNQEFARDTPVALAEPIECDGMEEQHFRLGIDSSLGPKDTGAIRSVLEEVVSRLPEIGGDTSGGAVVEVDAPHEYSLDVLNAARKLGSKSLRFTEARRLVPDDDQAATVHAFKQPRVLETPDVEPREKHVIAA